MSAGCDLSRITQGEEWDSNYRLGDGCSIKHGFAFKGSLMITENSEDLPIVVNIVNFQYTGGFRFDTTKIQRYLGKFPDEYILKPGDVLVVMTCQTPKGEILGIPGRIPDDGRKYLHNQRMGLVHITDSRTLDLGFLYYLFLSSGFNAHLFGSATGAKILHTSPSRIENYRFDRPPLRVQRRIAAILSAYDDLIENNTRRIKILEEMAQVLYREWFVHFRFPGHEKVRMVDSSLGRIPEGWEAAILGKAIRFQNGRAVKVDDQGKFPLYGSNGVIGKTIESRYRNGIIIGRVGAYCGSTFYCKSEFWASDNTIVAQAIDEDFLCTELIYYLLKNIDLRRNASGSAQPLLTQNVLKNLPVLIPDTATNKKFRDFLSSINDETINLKEKINNLRFTRDYLLPKMVSGEINASDLDIKVLNEAYYG